MRHILFLLVFLSTSASASLLIEPVGGYNLGTKLDLKGGETYSGGNGFAGGGRLGYQKLGFQVGVDYLHSYIDMDDSDWGSKLNMDEWAAFVGFELPVFFRVYAGYIFAAFGEIEDANNNKYEFSNGSGQKAGIGFTMLPFLDINLEYRRGTFGEKKVANVKDKEDTNYQSIMIGVSLPLNF